MNNSCRQVPFRVVILQIRAASTRHREGECLRRFVRRCLAYQRLADSNTAFVRLIVDEFLTLFIALDFHFNPAVIQILHVTRYPQSSGGVLCSVSEADSLNGTGYIIMSSFNHDL